MVAVKSKFSAEKVMPKLGYIVYHPESFSLYNRIVLFGGQETLASVIYWPIPIRRRHLHESVANSHIRCIDKHVEGLCLIEWLDYECVRQHDFQCHICLILYGSPSEGCSVDLRVQRGSQNRPNGGACGCAIKFCLRND